MKMIEKLLRDAGFSRNEAKYAVNGINNNLRDAEVKSEKQALLKQILRSGL